MRCKHVHTQGPYTLVKLEDIDGSTNGIQTIMSIDDRYLCIVCGVDDSLITVCTIVLTLYIVVLVPCGCRVHTKSIVALVL